MSISDLSTSPGTDRATSEPTMNPTERPAEQVPDGGLQAWATVVGGFMVYMAGLGYFNAYGVYQDFYVREFMTKSSPAKIAWIGSCQIALQFVLGLQVGKAFDAGYFRHLMIVGSIIYCFSLWMLSLAKPNQYYLVFLTQGVGLGVGLGLTFLPALSVAAQHFSRRRGLAIGIMTTGASIGGIMFPQLLNNLLFHHGFVVGVRATAVLITILMLLVSLRLIVTDLPYMMFVCSGIFVMLGLFYPIFYLQLYAINQGIPEKMAFDTITLIHAGGVVGRLALNFLALRVGNFNVLISVIFLAAACVLVMLAPALKSSGIIVISLLYGVMNAGYVSISPALLADLSNDRNEIGIRMGIWFTITAAAALGGQPLSGALILGYFRWSTVFAGLCLSAGGCLSILSRFLFLRSKGRGQRA